MKKSIKEYFLKVRNIKSKTWLIIAVVFIIIFMFYWQEVRPNLAKRSCYNQAINKAVGVMRAEKSEPYLYDREHWKGYKTYINRCGFFDITCDQNNQGPIQFTFEENLQTGKEPAYIQENLDKIKKEKDFYDDDYNKYYKRCLQSKGL